MREIQYKNFSLKAHAGNLGRDMASVCQLELTFGCGLHCKHCYTDCYNKTGLIAKELSTEKVKSLLDEVRNAGVLWLCFTGGDPLSRSDFPEIFSYAKDAGFIISVFTNGYSMTDDMIRLFKERPPFIIEITLNSVTEDLYEKISRVKGSFGKVMNGIAHLKNNKIPLKLKTHITSDNLAEVPKIKKFIEGLDLEFTPDHIIYPSLDGDLTPCGLRISASDVAKLYGLDKARHIKMAEYDEGPEPDRSRCLFPCALEGGDGINIDPYGNTFLCTLMREPKISSLKTGLKATREILLSRVRGKRFSGSSRCATCASKELCAWCPGKARAETGNMEKPIEYYCELSAAIGGKR